MENEINDKNRVIVNQDVHEDYKLLPKELNTHIDELKPVLLIVEDNLEVRLFLRQTLCKSYNIVEAVDGFDALEKKSGYTGPALYYLI